MRGDRALVGWVEHQDDQNPFQLRWLRTAQGYTNMIDADPGELSLGQVAGSPAFTILPSRDALVLWRDPGTPDTLLRSRLLSATAMVVPDEKLTEGTSVPVRWTAAGAETNDLRYDVRTRQATVRDGFTSARRWKRGTVKTRATYHATAGRTICFSTRARDSRGQVSSWSPQSCTAVPMDDRELTGTGWTSQRVRGAFSGSVRTASRRGLVLSAGRVEGRSIALLVRRTPDGGRVRIMLGHDVLGTFATQGKASNKSVIPVADFPRTRRGKLKIVTLDRARPVHLDGVFISAQ